MKQQDTQPTEAGNVSEVGALVETLYQDVSALNTQLDGHGIIPAHTLKTLLDPLMTLCLSVEALGSHCQALETENATLTHRLADTKAACDQMCIEISALQTKRDAAEKKAETLESRDRSSRARLESVTEQLDMTFGG